MLGSYTNKSLLFYKVILVGEASVGKSKIFKRYLNIESLDNPTIAVEYAYKIA